MLFEGTLKYFLGILIVFFIVFITVKICLYFIFRTCKIKGWKALVPFYNRVVLIDKLELPKKLFYKTLIPFVNLYYYKIIFEKMLKAFDRDSKEAIWFVIIPMYKFPELVFSKPKFILHLYDQTEKFLENQELMFTKVEEPEEIPVQVLEKEEKQEEIQTETYTADSLANIFASQNTKEDERKETIVDKKEDLKEEEKPRVIIEKGRPKVCPNCHTKLSPDAQTCFFCGTKIS